ncbi:C40 family peptidase [Rhodococcoides fascians]|uniref:C40 family peptidase n=1 Tax=Rhodococcoides fascians TaxID=1828 RepID=UPI00056AE2A7|nr:MULTISPECIES: C40 family peptidase [Rhodococcus]OZF07333.1 hydrolase [Rhodococcus sp. 15-1189-1-1a]OZF22858.1 hydrolase [Rhodococcus sp. 14-2686-1-2]
MIDLLARPITDLLGAFGSGVIPAGGPADVLRSSSRVLDSVQSVGRSAIGELAATWSGPAATAALDLAGRAQTSAVGLSEHGDEIAAVVDRACDKVQAGLVELQGILQSFVAVATTAAPVLFTPAGSTMLIGAAIDHLQRALAVVARVRAELAGHAAEIGAYAAPPPVPEPAGTTSAAGSPAPTPVRTVTASAPVSDPGSQFGQNFLRTVSASAPSMPDAPSSPISPSAAPAASSPPSGMSMYTGTPDRTTADTGAPGRGVQVALPDGSVATAPNEQAAGAVRSALTQQGTPYVWGGTSPGQGLDCSGLTQWAYGEQGVELPRLAQEQNVGTQVGQDELMPGDLAIWDGHVAMVIGNGQLVEAGDPVQVGEIRTTNAGMGFKGFYRPTE